MMFVSINLAFLVFNYLLIYILVKKQNRKKVFAIVTLIHLLFVRCLMDGNSAVDSENYVPAFYNIAEMSFIDVLTPNYYTAWGPGYLLSNWLVSRFTLNYQIFYIIIAFVTLISVIRFYYKSSYNFFIVAVFFIVYPMLYRMEFGVLRQHLSISIGVLTLLNSNKTWSNIIVTLFATSIHLSGIVFLPFIFLKGYNFASKNFIKIVVYIIIGLFVFRYVENNLVMHIQSSEDVLLGDKQNNIVPAILLGSLFFCYTFSGVTKITDIAALDRTLINWTLYGFAISLFCIGLPGAGRLTLPFIYTFPVGLTLLYKYSTSKFINRVYTLMVALLVILLLIEGADTMQFRYIPLSINNV